MTVPFDWAGNALICLGLWYMGARKWWAFAFSLVGESVWVLYSFQHRLWSLAFICAVFAVLALRNLVKWRKET
jgi:hypothetical protein